MALSRGLYMSNPCAHSAPACAFRLICHRPRESSPWGLWAPVSPPDSASAMAVIVTDWSGEKPAARA